MRKRRPARIARRWIEVETETPPVGDFDLAAREYAKPQFWTLQVHQDGDRAAGAGLDPANDLDPGSVIFVRSMAEIEPKDVDAGAVQRFDLLRRRTGGAERGHDAGVT